MNSDNLKLTAENKELRAHLDMSTNGLWSEWELERAKVKGELEALQIQLDIAKEALWVSVVTIGALYPDEAFKFFNADLLKKKIQELDHLKNLETFSYYKSVLNDLGEDCGDK